MVIEILVKYCISLISLIGCILIYFYFDVFCWSITLFSFTENCVVHFCWKRIRENCGWMICINILESRNSMLQLLRPKVISFLDVSLF